MDKLQLRYVGTYSPQHMHLVLMLAFRPFLWTLVRRSVLALQVSQASAGIWKNFPEGRNLHKPRFGFRRKLCYFGETHRICCSSSLPKKSCLEFSDQAKKPMDDAGRRRLLEEECSLFYSKRFCLPCVKENLKAFPLEIQEDMDKRKPQQKPSKKNIQNINPEGPRATVLWLGFLRSLFRLSYCSF